MKKAALIISIGLVLGLLDLIPLFLAKAPLYNMVSIIVFWLCATFFIYKTNLVKNNLLNGLMVAVLLMLPMALAVSASNSKDFLPMMVMAIILGPIAGMSLNKYVR
jgi:hypothetical protein